jgi:[acyl-carrier-protein] S-malonyltransferase
MGKALADAFLPARVVFEEVDAALGDKLTKVIWEGPAETLTLTENAQPALLGLDFDQAVTVAVEAAQGQVCEAANDNGGQQVVVSGDKGAVERAVEIAKGKGAKRAMMLPVSAPFHCALMRPAADAMAAALAEVAVKPPVVPIVANVLARPVSDPGDIVRALVAQVTGTVRWRESIAFMAAAGVTTFYEVGAGKVLSGLVKRIVDGASGVPIGTPGDIAAFKVHPR